MHIRQAAGREVARRERGLLPLVGVGKAASRRLKRRHEARRFTLAGLYPEERLADKVGLG